MSTEVPSSDTIILHDAMDSSDTCTVGALSVRDAMDRIIDNSGLCMETEQIIEFDNCVLCVETTTPTLVKLPVALQVETKECVVKLTRLETILADDLIIVPPSSASDLPPGIHFTCSRSAPNQQRQTRKPRRASKNIKYEEDNVKTEIKPMKPKPKPTTTKPSRQGPDCLL